MLILVYINYNNNGQNNNNDLKSSTIVFQKIESKFSRARKPKGARSSEHHAIFSSWMLAFTYIYPHPITIHRIQFWKIQLI